MTVLRIAVFLFGTFALASSKAFVPMVGMEIAKTSTGKLLEHNPPGAPFISNFIQEGTNVFYKPHFSMASHIAHPEAMIVESKDCNEVPLMPAPVLSPAVMEEPLKIVETVIPSNNFEQPHIKEVIEIKPMMPEVIMSTPVVSTPVLMPEPTIIPEALVISPTSLPDLSVPAHDIIVRELSTLPTPIEPLPAVEEEPVITPEAPVLPSISELPKLSVIETLPPVMAVSELPATDKVEEPVPEAPVLPPMEMPELPKIVEEVPVAPISTMIEVPVIIPETPLVIPEAPVVIPEAPILPPLVMPEIPTIVEEPMPIVPDTIMVEEPVLTPEAPLLSSVSDNTVATIIETPIMPAPEPVVIPEAPVLPPMPELPKLEVAEIQSVMSEPVLTPIEAAPLIVEEPAVIPEAPLLPSMVSPELPTPVVIEEKIPVEEVKGETPLVMPTAPVFPQQLCVYPFAMPCSYPNPMPPPYMPLAGIPQAPFMHPFMPQMSQVPVHSERIEINRVMSALPSSLSFPTSCAQEIIAERVLPNIGGPSMIAAPALTHPVPASYMRL